jgi:hypothetical protein
MDKRASEEGGIDVIKTSGYGKVYMDQHKETLEIMMGHFKSHLTVLLTIRTFVKGMSTE